MVRERCSIIEERTSDRVEIESPLTVKVNTTDLPFIGEALADTNSRRKRLRAMILIRLFKTKEERGQPSSGGASANSAVAAHS